MISTRVWLTVSKHLIISRYSNGACWEWWWSRVAYLCSSI